MILQERSTARRIKIDQDMNSLEHARIGFDDVPYSFFAHQIDELQVQFCLD